MAITELTRVKRIRPLGRRVLVKCLEDLRMSPGGLHLTVERLPSVGEVVAIGPGAYVTEKNKTRFRETSLEPGEVVMFDPNACQDLMINDERHVLVLEDFVLGVVPQQER